MKNLIYILTLSVLIVSCNSDDNNNDNSYYAIDTGITILIKDFNGNDLLNPNNSNAYLEENIKIYYLKENGDVEEVYNSNLDAPRNFSIITPEDSFENVYAFSLQPNTSIMENAITYIEWNDTETDIIKTNYRYGDNHIICNEVWYNGVNVWTEDLQINSGRAFEIIKN